MHINEQQHIKRGEATSLVTDRVPNNRFERPHEENTELGEK